MTSGRNDLVPAGSAASRSTSPSSKSATTTSVKSVGGGNNNKRVKQAGRQDLTISLSPAKMDVSIGHERGKPGVRMLRRRSDGPLSIVIHPTPKRQVSAKDGLMSYKIHSPADNVSILLMGGSSKTPPRKAAPPSNPDSMLPNGECVSANLPSCCRSPERSRSPKGQQSSMGGPNAVKVRMARSGMEVNINMGGDDAKVQSDGSPAGSRSPRGGNASGSAGATGGADKEGCKNSRLCYHPTISSLIATRMAQVQKEMLITSGSCAHSDPIPPFVSL